MRKKGFTLIELLVVIAIIALLMGILMPALARVRLIAYRMVCGSNLGGIGKAILLYAGDTQGEFPLPGIRRPAVFAENGKIRDWTDPLGFGAGDRGVYGTSCGSGTIGSVFFLLVKYADVSVKQYNCKGDAGVKMFKLTDWSLEAREIVDPPDDITKAWDFGRNPGAYCSYSYNNPFSASADGTSSGCGGGFRVNADSSAGSPLAADRNPTMDKNVDYLLSSYPTLGGDAVDQALDTPFELWISDHAYYSDPDKLYNSFAHQRDGQNVLYADGHVAFESQANVGLDGDNIWQKRPDGYATSADRKKDREVGGTFPYALESLVDLTTSYNESVQNYASITRMSLDDALLINEWQHAGFDPGEKP